MRPAPSSALSMRSLFISRAKYALGNYTVYISYQIQGRSDRDVRDRLWRCCTLSWIVIQRDSFDKYGYWVGLISLKPARAITVGRAT